MTKINRKAEYALIALKHMSRKRPGEVTSAKEISDFYQLPFDTTSRVLQIMSQHQILKATQGVTGGYLITKDLARVSLFDLMALLLGPMDIAKCLHGSDPCEIKSTCNIVTPISLLNQKLSEFYKGIMVWDLLNPAPKEQTRMVSYGQ